MQGPLSAPAPVFRWPYEIQCEFTTRRVQTHMPASCDEFYLLNRQGRIGSQLFFGYLLTGTIGDGNVNNKCNGRFDLIAQPTTDFKSHELFHIN